jgi:hypothetical protein
VTVGRVSQIDNGELAGIDVLNRYVHALGGDLQIVALPDLSVVRAGSGGRSSSAE